MTFRKYTPAILLLSTLLNSPAVFADTIIQTTVTSNYLANGISLTDDKPALQVGINYEHESGLYAGGMASNLSLGKEVDINAGYYYKVHEALGFDI
ncbi:MAG: TorF family putative porin, partial [Gammaproteobacteria bacterium]|nr:TorF family putative porin [Gammaproteobacteria bacterium]